MFIIGNGMLATRNSKNELIENGCVVIDGKVIVEIGDTTTMTKKYPQAKLIDAKGKLIMPGFINAHGHIYSAFARGLSVKNYSPKTFLDVLEGMWWNIDRHLMLSQTKASADATYLSCIENGVTTYFDHHASFGEIEGSLSAIAQSANEYGVRTNLCYEISDRDGEDKMKASVRENIEFINWVKHDESDMVKAMLGMHASFTLSDNTLNYAMSQKPSDIGVHIHVAEGMLDVIDCKEKYGMNLISRLSEFGILGEKSILGHCIHISEEEMDTIAKTNTMVVHNPESNMGNAVGCPPVLKLFEKGILIGLGTDGYTNDMCESYKVANIIHKHENKNPNVAWAEIPTMLFENNAKMANRFFKRNIGKLEEGAYADVIVVDYTPQTPLSKDNINGHILFGVNGMNVVTTVINGEVKMLDRELIGIDKEAVMAHCREQASSLWASINN